MAGSRYGTCKLTSPCTGQLQVPSTLHTQLHVSPAASHSRGVCWRYIIAQTVLVCSKCSMLTRIPHWIPRLTVCDGKQRLSCLVLHLRHVVVTSLREGLHRRSHRCDCSMTRHGLFLSASCQPLVSLLSASCQPYISVVYLPLGSDISLLHPPSPPVFPSLLRLLTSPHTDNFCDPGAPSSLSSRRHTLIDRTNHIHSLYTYPQSGAEH